MLIQLSCWSSGCCCCIFVFFGGFRRSYPSAAAIGLTISLIDAMPPKKTKPAIKASSKSGTPCQICEDIILESTVSKEGHDSILCEGACAGWLHRWCAGLSKSGFNEVSKSKDKFLCVSCRLRESTKEVSDLRKRVEDLESKIASLVSPINSTSGRPSYASAATPSNINGGLATTTTNPARATSKANLSDGERKFNVIVCGIEESSDVPTRAGRQTMDIEKVVTTLSPIVDNISPLSIKDSFRLGKYQQGNTRPRPILVKFVRSADARSVLDNARQLSHPFFVRPDKPPAERKRDKCLLDVRWSLIQGGIERKTIKIRKFSLFVNNVLLGKADLSGTFKYEDGAEPDLTRPLPSKPDTQSIASSPIPNTSTSLPALSPAASDSPCPSPTHDSLPSKGTDTSQ